MCTTGAHAIRNNDNCKKSYSSCLLGVTMQHLELDPEATAIWFQPLWGGIKRVCHGLFFPYQKHFPASLLLSLQQASVLSEASFHVLSFLCPEKPNLRLESAKHLPFSLLFCLFCWGEWDLACLQTSLALEPSVYFDRQDRQPPPAWWVFHYDSVKYNGYFA